MIIFLNTQKKLLEKLNEIWMKKNDNACEKFNRLYKTL